MVDTGDMTTQVTLDAADAAAGLGVVDALVFRRIGPRTWAHLGGLGRGEAWAGIIDVDETEDPLAVRIPHQVGTISRERFDEPARVLGPYYAASGAIVRVTGDVAVVFGTPGGPLTCDDDDLLRLACLLDRTIDDVHPTKRLADELEVLHTVRDLMEAPVDSGLGPTLAHLVTVATTALDCDVGVLRGSSGRMTVVGDGHTAEDDWSAALDEIAELMHDDLWCAQDMTAVSSQRVRETIPFARSMMAMPVPPPIGGHLLAVHTAANPRGFNRQCQRLCRHVIETGSIMARTALLRDELRRAADTASAAARTDPLTGLGNRLAWDEAIASRQAELDAGKVVTVITVDLDGLKTINDRYGHDAGDGMLRACSDIIRRHCDDADLAVRMGGDEFAVLVPHALDPAGGIATRFIAELAGPAGDRNAVSASVGMCTAHPGGSLADALREADLHMYRNKRARR
jgi:diguanylate cyclase (GGDEF)-like protein